MDSWREVEEDSSGRGGEPLSFVERRNQGR